MKHLVAQIILKTLVYEIILKKKTSFHSKN